MQSPSRIVVVLATGGTIAGVAGSAGDDLGYRSATLPIQALLAELRPAGVALEAEQVAQVDSKDMTPAIWRRLATRIARHLARPGVAGVVVTHGTDTLEETAWFLERVLRPARPVVLTGAMRPATSAAADGPRNLADAVAFAATAGVAGVVAVMAGAAHAAGAVRKVHPHRLDAFSSGDVGPIATLRTGRWRVLRAPEGVPGDAGTPAIGLAALPAQPQAWPWVEIVTSHAGADGRAVAGLIAAGVAGIVVGTTGNGTVHRTLEASLRAAMRRGVAVLRSTRCIRGSVLAAPATGRAALPLAADLTPAQARVELMLRLLELRASAPPRRPAPARRRRA